MAFIDLVCKKCGHSFEEIVKGGQYPCCPMCGGSTVQNYNGLKTPPHKKGCGGDCKSCRGCGK